MPRVAGGRKVIFVAPIHDYAAATGFFQTALKKEVLYVPGELCYADDPSRAKPNHEMRLSFGGATEKNIHEGIKRLGRLIKNRL